jgi:hypothetical protein
LTPRQSSCTLGGMTDTERDTRYIVEADLEGDDPGATPTVLAFSREELSGWLKSNIQMEHYSGFGDQVRAIYRYDGDGKTTKLILRSLGEDRDPDDYLDWRFDVIPAKIEDIDPSGEPEFEFTVRIDGRA